MDLYEAMYTTRAMRRVKPDPIPDDVLGRIFDAAVRGPSGGNSHTFRFLTVTDKATMAKLKSIYHDAYWELQETTYAGVQDQLENGDPERPERAAGQEDFVVGRALRRQARRAPDADLRVRQGSWRVHDVPRALEPVLWLPAPKASGPSSPRC